MWGSYRGTEHSKTSFHCSLSHVSLEGKVAVAFLGALDPSSLFFLLWLTSVLHAVVTPASRPEENMLTDTSATGAIRNRQQVQVSFSDK